jgi:hypothetical protein
MWFLYLLSLVFGGAFGDVLNQNPEQVSEFCGMIAQRVEADVSSSTADFGDKVPGAAALGKIMYDRTTCGVVDDALVWSGLVRLQVDFIDGTQMVMVVPRVVVFNSSGLFDSATDSALIVKDVPAPKKDVKSETTDI